MYIPDMVERSKAFLTRRQALATFAVGLVGAGATIAAMWEDEARLQARHQSPASPEKAASARATVTVFESQAIATAVAGAPQQIQEAVALDNKVRVYQQELNVDRYRDNFSVKIMRNGVLIASSLTAVFLGGVHLIASKSEPHPIDDSATS